MMVNLFSTFDPTTSSMMGWSLNWGGLGVGLSILPLMFWMLPTRVKAFWVKINMILHKELQLLMGRPPQGATLMLLGLFYFILFNNFLGLFPFIFTSTSHLSITLMMGLPLWLSFMSYGWWNHMIYMLAHQVPEGTPPGLMPFMVIIETLSNIIRPGTLAVRLMANMTAGHLLMTLLGNTGATLSGVMLGGLLSTQVFLLLLEMAVALIQSYVFVVLSTLYMKEAIH
uniref:ATP synthase subunit a n=1 Tax=Paratimomenus flavocapitatus TaxID=2021295 RepID=A0A678QEW0_9NEOP|nr:ATP synthase F0 subunit 6 [Paratimomenus flavocapitatus]